MLRTDDEVYSDTPTNGSWKVIGSLGSGTCCEVYKVKGIGKTQKYGALKIFKAGGNFERAYDAEAMLLDLVIRANGPSKYLVQTYEDLDHDDHPCLVQELLDLDLRQILTMNQGQGLSLYLIQRLSMDILRGVNHLHKSGFVHADLKPTNVMWSPPDACMKIIDYSLSFHAQDQNIDRLQSSGYRAPEVDLWNDICLSKTNHEKLPENLMAVPKPSRACDMWSVGCLMADMLAGRKVFTQEKINEIQHLQKSGVPMGSIMTELVQHLVKSHDSLRENLPAADKMEDLLNKLLCIVIEDRISSHDVLSHPFFSCEFAPGFRDLCLLTSPVLRLMNVVDDEDLREEQPYQDLKLDLTEECSRYGQIQNCIIPRDGRGQGKVFIEYSDCEYSREAYTRLCRREYNGRTVILTYFLKDDYDKGNFY